MKRYCSVEVLKWLKENAYTYISYDPAETPYRLETMPKDFTPARLDIPLSSMGKARLKNQLKEGKNE